MAYTKALGDWLEGSGWTSILEKARISTPGRIESFLSGNNVKRCRYAHQLSLAALLKLSHAVFDRDSAEDYESWKGC